MNPAKSRRSDRFLGVNLLRARGQIEPGLASADPASTTELKHTTNIGLAKERKLRDCSARPPSECGPSRKR
jgi:hypothetical protein